MNQRQATRVLQLRRRIAEEAARIMVESGSRNFLQAKRKAAQKLGIPDARHLPGNHEVEEALVGYQRLFLGHEQPRHLHRLREVAAEGMRFLERFSPRLVGPVLDGTADQHSEVNLHLFADPVEMVAHFLMEQGIPNELGERRLRMPNGEYVRLPEYRFLAGDVAVALTVFSGPGAHQPPLSPVTGRPMHRAGLSEVDILLAEVGGDKTSGHLSDLG